VGTTVYDEHYGSAYTMSDYTSKSHNLYMTASFMPTPVTNITLSVNYHLSKASLDQVIFPDVRAQLADTLAHQDFTFDEMNTYSDLDYGILQLGAGLEYKLTPQVTWSSDIEYYDLKDDAPYVYGDESGSIFFIRSGVRFDF